MMATHQHCRYRGTFVDFRSRVMRTIEQAINEAVFNRRCIIMQDPGQLPDYRIHQCHRRDFTA
ncbi:hypothetical protein D3C81_1553750 [compost metagenome]